jgi:RNA polymerase sigma factor for flagellar operon FliA
MNHNTSAEHVHSSERHSAAGPTGSNREEMIVNAMPLVRTIAKHLALRLPPCITLEELSSAGTVGLVKAASRFDLNRGMLFASYAKHRIRGEMLDFLRAQDPLSRTQRRARQELGDGFEAPVHLTDAIVVATDYTPTDPLIRARVSGARKALSTNEDRVIELSFYAGWNNRETAQEMGVHESRISQLKTRALSKLRERLARPREAA